MSPVPCRVPVPAAVAAALTRTEGRREGRREEAARAGGRRLPGRRRRHSGLGADKMSAIGAARRGGDVLGVRRRLGPGSEPGRRRRAEPSPPCSLWHPPAGAESGRQPPGAGGARRAERSMAGQGRAVQVRRPCPARSSAQALPWCRCRGSGPAGSGRHRRGRGTPPPQAGSRPGREVLLHCER